MSKTPLKLFIPGPVHLWPDTLDAFHRPVIDHRSADFFQLYSSLQPRLRKLFHTANPVYCMTNSSFGAMEAGVRNCVRDDKKILMLANGIWGEKWHQVALNCGKQSPLLSWEWGQPIDSQMVEKKLHEGGWDAVAFVSSETSCGVRNPLEEIMAVIRKFPDVISIVDAVTSFSAMEIKQDELGIDVLLTGTQKALALPPGMALASVSPRALMRAQAVKNRGYYLDFLEYQKLHEQNQTPTTPNIPLFFCLQYRCDQIDQEGIENRHARHRAINQHVVEWAASRGFPLFPQAGYATVSLVCGRNDRGVDLEKLNAKLIADHRMMINTGYGKLKGKTFRISTMGDETIETVTELTNNLDKVLSAL